MADRALSFGAVAAAYERFRPGYPDALFDTVADYAGRPIRTALEIGAGTGKATRLFAGRGVPVTATEPDPAMLAELRMHVPATVTAVQSAFENIPLDHTYDLVYAAAAMHWTDPVGRWEQVAALLEPGGVFASFGGPMRLTDPAVETAVRAAREPFLDTDDIAPPEGLSAADSMQWPGAALERSGCFADVRECVIERRMAMPAADYVGNLSTVSAYRQLSDADREEVLARIARVLPESVEISADIIVHLARRRDQA